MPSKATSSTTGATAIVLYWTTLAMLWFATLGQRALIHPDEGRYAELSLGMLQSGDWITPRLNGILYFEKPVLQYWMGTLSFMGFGVNEFAARFWPALTGFLAVAAVGWTARRLWGCGHYAALVLAGSFWVIGNSHFLNLDSGLMFFLTLVLCAFLVAQRDDATPSERRYGMWLAWAAMAGAVLSKGLVGVLIPGATLVLYSLIERQWRPWSRMQWVVGSGILLLLAVPWFWMVSARNPGFASFFFIHEHFARYLTNEAQREGPLWYFVPLLLIGFLPWTSLLPRLIRESWTCRDGEQFRPERFLTIWAAFVFAFFSLSQSKLPSYILPLFPALALLLGRSLIRIDPDALKRHLWLPAAVWGLLCCTYPLAGFFASPDLPLPALRHFTFDVAAGGAVFLLCAALAYRQLAKARTLLAIMLLTAGSLVATLSGIAGHDAFRTLKSSKTLVERIQPYLHPDTPVFTIHNAYDQTLPFYLHRPVIQVDYQDEFAFGQNAEPDKASLTMDDFVARWESGHDALAVMDRRNFDDFKTRGLLMKPVYEDARRLVVAKP